MKFNSYELHAGRIIEYFVKSYHYQVVKVKQATTDVWLVNARNKQYPVIRVSAVVEDIEQKQLYLRQVHRTLLDLFHREANLLLINTNPESIPMENPYMKQICVNKHGVSDIAILKEFSQLDQCYSEFQEKEEELARITRVIEEEQLKNRSQFYKDTTKHLQPTITYWLFAIIVFMFIIGMVLGVVVEDGLTGWIISGMYYKMNIVSAHEYWRFITAGFIHANPFTLFFTLYALYKVGRVAEPLFTKISYVSLFLLGIIIGNVCMLIATENTIGYGAGAGVSSIIGGYLALTLERSKHRRPILPMMYFQSFLIIFILALLPSISILGHIVSFVSGFFIIFIWKNKKHAVYRHMQIACLLLFVGIFVLGIRVQRIEPLEPVVDERIVESYRKLGIHHYADYLQIKYQEQYDLQK